MLHEQLVKFRSNRRFRVYVKGKVGKYRLFFRMFWIVKDPCCWSSLKQAIKAVIGESWSVSVKSLQCWIHKQSDEGFFVFEWPSRARQQTAQEQFEPSTINLPLSLQWVRKFLKFSGEKFRKFILTFPGNFRKFVNYLCQSAVSKSSIAKWCCKISMFLTNNSPDLYAFTLCIMFRKITCF